MTKAHIRSTSLLSIVLSAIVFTSGHAADIAYVWANKADASPTYIADSSYVYNAAGSVTISQTLFDRPGIYSLGINNLVDDPFVSVVATAYGNEKKTCVADTFGLGRISVSCYDQDGSHAESRFSVMTIRAQESDIGKFSFAWVSQYALDRREVYVTQSFPNEYVGAPPMAVSEVSPGVYQIGLGDLAQTRNVVLTNATPGIFLLRHCNPQNWSGGKLTVRCYDKDGNPAFSPFTVMAFHESMSGVSFVWNSNLNGGTPNASHAHASDGSIQNIIRTAKGQYTVKLGPEADAGGHVQASMYRGNGTCNVRSWNDGTAFIGCFGTDGAAQDAMFTAVAIQRVPLLPLELPGVVLEEAPLQPEWILRKFKN